MRSTRNLAHIVSVSAFLVAGVLSSRTAHAEADTFGLGSGRTGAGAITAANTVVNSYASVTADVALNATTITVDNGALFAAGDLVLVWQTTGVAAAVSGSQTAVVLSGAPGTFEYARVKSVAANVVTLTNPIASATGYAASFSQLVKVPEYTTLSVAAGGGLIATPWDGSKGGIVVAFATGAITNNGTIAADHAGFRGGVIKNDDTVYGCLAFDGPVVAGTLVPGGGGATFNVLAGGAKKGEGLVPGAFSTSILNPTDALNTVTYGRGNITSGGGGGDCHNAGGGGGGHGSTGGNGGGTYSGELDATGAVSTGGRTTASGLGGAPVTYDPLTRLTFGGGGGAGEENNSGASDGASGAGVVVLRGASLAGTGIVSANGATATNSTNDGAGGGGAGGLVVVRVSGNATCGGLLANGGGGGHSTTNHGPGAGGSGGVILLQSATAACTATEAPGPQGDDGADAGRGSNPGGDGITATPPAGGYTPSPCDQNINTCGGCVFNSDCATGFTCNTTINVCTDFFPDGGLIPDGGSLLPDGGILFPDGGLLSDGGLLPDGGFLTDGGLLADGGSPTDGGVTDGGGGTDGGNGGDGGSGLDGGGSGDGGNGDDGGSSNVFFPGDLEGGGCGCSTPGTDDTENGTAALGLGLIAGLAFLRRKKR